MTLTQSEAEKLARKWFVDNGIGFDGARLVKLTQFIREIENAAYARMAKVTHRHQVDCLNRAWELREQPRHESARQMYEFGATVAVTIEGEIHSLIQPPAQKEDGE